MDIITIPDEIACLELLEKYSTPRHIILHSIRVWQVGKILGEGLLRRGHVVDMALLRASCLLHDIGKYPCIVEGGGFHDLRGQQILGEEGFPSVGHIVVQHIVLRGGENDPVAEEHVVYYADKRVVHDEVVSLDDRFDYLQRTYGRSPGAVLKVMEMKEEAVRVEREIFMLLDFSPDDIVRLIY